MTETFQLPVELTLVPKPFVVLTGLNIKQNAIHQSIWDAFVNNRHPNRAPLNLACLPGDHPYPKSKTARTSYDWYIPKGLLKTGWINKHLNQVPAVVAIFIELDWDDPAWQERHQACASRIQVVRASLQGRNTKLAVVLIQNKTPMQPGDDPGSSAVTRANALCSACELSAKSLFVLPITDHVLGYVTRLEGAFFELAQSYYYAECRQIEAHKEFLNKTTHQLLFPRHRFKIAFFHEMMQETGARRKALKHYEQCYSLIQELRSYDTNNLEIKLIAGFVNYKICQLSFLHLDPPTPLDAISQFRRHIDHFKSRHGSSELLFEHSAWLCHQFTLFGELFDAAITNSLTAIQTQHPGFYFYQAARYARGRKAFAAKLCTKVDKSYPVNDPLKTEKLEFYGQRPWRQGQQRIDPPDMAQEQEGILALQLIEADFDHSSLIIKLLTRAVEHVKKFKSPRLKLSLTVQTAEEYFAAGDYWKALVLLKHAAYDYAIDDWSVPLSRSLALALHCAYLMADKETSLESFVTLCVCAVSSRSGFEKGVKEGIQRNFERVLQAQAPIQADLPMNAIDVTVDDNKVQDGWNLLLKTSTPVTLNMKTLASFIDCKIAFQAGETPVSSQANLHVYLKTTCPLPVEFSELTIGFNDSSYDIVQKTLIRCEHNKMTKQNFSFSIKADDLKKVVSVISLSLQLKGLSDLKFLWQWTEMKPSTKVFHFEELAWDHIPNLLSTSIIERRSRLVLDVEHAPPILVNEDYPIRLKLKSKEEEGDVARDIKVTVSLRSDQQQTSAAISSRPSNSKKELSSGKSILNEKLSDLGSGEESSLCVYMITGAKGSVDVDVVVTYSMTLLSGMKCTSTMTQQFSVQAAYAFEVATSALSSNLQGITHVQPCQPFVFMIQVKPATKWPIELVQCESATSCKSIKLAASRMPPEVQLSSGETAVDCFSATCNEEEKGVESFGTYAVKWRRAGADDDIPAIWTRVLLPSLPIQHVPLLVTMVAPPYGLLHEQVSVQYRIHNSTDDTRSVEIRLDPAESFTFSGDKYRRALILPGQSHRVPFNFFPLACGYRALPRFTVKLSAHQYSEQQPPSKGDLQQSIDHSHLSTHLYVKPQPLTAT